jgi:basic amino acid/polyamine antiporter, APA family
MRVLPLQAIADESRVASRTAEVLVGPIGGGLVAALIAMSTFGTASVYTLAAPRIYYAMARDGLFFQAIGRLHPKYGTPATALAAQWCIVTAFILTGTFDALISYVAFVDWIFYAAAAGAVFVFRRTLRDAPRTYRTPGYPIVPALFILVALWFVVFLFYNEPVRSGIGLAIFLSAVPVSFVWMRKGRGERNEERGTRHEVRGTRSEERGDAG